MLEWIENAHTYTGKAEKAGFHENITIMKHPLNNENDARPLATGVDQIECTGVG